MNARNRIHNTARNAALVGLLTLASSALGQPVIAPAPATQTAPSGYPQGRAGGTQVTPSSEAVSPVPGEAPLLQQGFLGVRPRLTYRWLHGDGIQSTLGHPETTVIQTVSPGVLIELGSHWTLDYSPTWTFYSNHTFRDTVDHAASLAGGYTSTDSSIGFSQSYTRTSPTLVETGQQTRQESYATSIDASRRLGRRSQLAITASHSVRHADEFTDSSEWSASGMLHYQFSAQLDAAVGLSLGYVDVNVGSDMTYSQPQIQISWRPTDKVSFDGHGGIERREFRSGGTGSMDNPFYGASFHYLPTETTTLTLEANRGVSTSYFASEVTESTGWGASLQQRLLEEFSLSVGFAQAKTNYVATESTVTAGRDDKNYSLNVRLSTTFLRRGSVAIFYQKGHNSSNSVNYAFSSNQYGLDIGYRF